MGRGVTVRRRAQAVVRAKLERSNYSVLPPAPAADVPDKLPRSLRRMLRAKADDDARAARKAEARQAAAARKAGVAVVAVAAPKPVVARPPSPPPPPQKPAAVAAPKPPPAAAQPPSSRKAKRKERAKALKAKKAARKKRGREEESDEDGPPATRPAFGETADAPINVTLKTRHWGDASRLGAMFERQLATARARAEAGGVSAADREAVIEAYRARKGGNVGSATRTSLKELVAAGAARAASAADAKKKKK